MSSQTPHGKTKRGVVTSREKLDVAMVAAGIKSQTALAELIRENENLDNPPRDMVSRAFRQIAIDTTSVVRIAKALNVDAYTLYLSSDSSYGNDNENSVTSTATAVSKQSLINKRSSALLLVCILALFVVRNEWKNKLTSVFTPNAPILGQYSLVLHSYSHNTDALAQEIANQLKQNFTVMTSNRALLDKITMSVDIAAQYQADGVVTIRNTTFGRYVGLQVYLYLNGVEKLIWTESFPQITATQQQKLIATNFIPFLEQSLRPNSDTPLLFSDLKAQQNYLQARQLIDDYQSELKLKRAQVLLHSVIQTFPRFAKAHAALCESYLRDSWRSNEKDGLEHAQLACDAALNIAPNQPYARSMLGYLYHRSGRVDEAITLFQELLDLWPNNIDALSGLSYGYRAAFLQELAQYPNAREKMLSNAKKITQLEPDYWQHHSTLGLHSYVAGDRHAAIQAFGVAARLNPSQLAYVNVGTIAMCVGDIDKAEDFYREAQQIAPDSYHGNDYLGTLAFYRENFHLSSKLKKKALDTFGESSNEGTHQMWGDLADAYRRDNQTDKSVSAYLQALKIIQRDTLRGNTNASDKVYRHYYSLIMTTIAPAQYSRQALNLDISQLKALAKHEIQSTAQARLAFAFYLYEEISLAKRALANAAAVCPIYNEHPDLAPISSTD